jgi:hypothetical protein
MDGKREVGLRIIVNTENNMKKVLIIAAFLTTISLPAFAQSYDSDLGTGNIVPPIANVGPANAYAQAPGYVARRTSRGTYHRSYRQIDRDNTSVPGQGVDKDDTTPVWWR